MSYHYEVFKHLCSYVLDFQRTNAYNRFLKTHAKDKVVCDLGTGTGILSYLASVHGAKKIYSYEITYTSYQQSKEMLKDYNVIQYNANLVNVTFPTDVDFFIHELMYNVIFRDDTIKIFNNVKKQYPLAKIYPSEFDVYVGARSPQIESVYDRSLYDKEVLDYIDILEQHGLYIPDALVDLNSREEIPLQYMFSFSIHDDLTKTTLPERAYWKTKLDDHEFGNYPRIANNWGIS